MTQDQHELDAAELGPLLLEALPLVAAFHVSVPAESTAEQREIAEHAHAWNRANGHPFTRTHLGWHTYRDVTPPGSPFSVAEVDDLYVEWTFPVDVGPDPLLAFAEMIAPYAWPERPALRLEAKGAEA